MPLPHTDEAHVQHELIAIAVHLERNHRTSRPRPSFSSEAPPRSSARRQPHPTPTGPPEHGGPHRAPDGTPPVPTLPWILASRVLDPESGLTARRKDFTRADALAAVMDAVPGLESAAMGEALTDDVLDVTDGGARCRCRYRCRCRRSSAPACPTPRYTGSDVLAAEQVLAAEAGIASKTVAAWLRHIEDGPGLTGVDVLVVDEGAKVDDRSVAALLGEGARTGTKVVGIGGPQQLQPVGVGGGPRDAPPGRRAGVVGEPAPTRPG